MTKNFNELPQKLVSINNSLKKNPEKIAPNDKTTNGKIITNDDSCKFSIF